MREKGERAFSFTPNGRVNLYSLPSELNMFMPYKFS